jgi:casein kinase 1
MLVIDLPDPSWEDLFNHCNKKFTAKTVFIVAKQMVCRPTAPFTFKV